MTPTKTEHNHIQGKAWRGRARQGMAGLGMARHF